MLETTWNAAQKAVPKSDQRWKVWDDSPGKIYLSHFSEWAASISPWYSKESLKATVRKFRGSPLKANAASMLAEINARDELFKTTIEKIRDRENSTEATATAGTGTSSGAGL